MNKVIVNINGSEYPMVGQKSESHMLNVARYVDSEMRNCSQKNPKLSTSSVAVLVAINITDQLFECGEENDKLIKENKELNQKVGTTDGELKLELKKLQLKAMKRDEEIQELNKVVEKQKEELSQLQNEISVSSESTNELKAMIEELKNRAEEAEKKAKIAEKMSSKFQNDAYRVQLEKIEIENELKYLRANR